MGKVNKIHFFGTPFFCLAIFVSVVPFCWLVKTVLIQSSQGCQAVRLQPKERKKRERRFSDALNSPSVEAGQQWHSGSGVKLIQLLLDFGQK